MPRVVVRVEADVVGAEHPAEELLALRDHPVELGGGEGDVEEEADDDVGAELAERVGDREEVEVVDPHVGPLGGFFRDALGEAVVHVEVGGEGLAIVDDPIGEVVEEGPDDPVPEAVVVVLDVVVGEEDGSEAVLVERALDRRFLGGIDDEPRPPDPRRRVLGHARERRGEPAAAHPRMEGAISPLEGDGEAVADEHQRALASGVPNHRSIHRRHKRGRRQR